MMCFWRRGLDIPSTAYANAGGTGDRTASITVTISGPTGGAIVGGTASNLVDGGFAANTTDSVQISPGWANGNYIRFDFGVGVKKYIDEVKIYNDRALTPSWGNWKFRVSDDAASWTDLNTFAWDTQTETDAVTGMDPAGFRYLQIESVGGGGSAPNGTFFEEVEFKIALGAT